MSEITNQENAAVAAPVKPLIHRIWPTAIVGVGLGITVAWTFILAYGFIRLVELLIKL